MPIPRNEKEIVERLPELRREAELNPPPRNPEELYGIVVLNGVDYTRKAVEGALKDLPGDTFSDLARCDLYVLSYTKPHDLDGSTGGWLAFSGVVRYGYPERYHQLGIE